MNTERLQQARRSRDPRFDGKFFVAVKTTGIYCRPICPAPLPHEDNVRYYSLAALAAADGYRPCLRCRPDAAPHSYAWQGVNTTLDRALRLINEGALATASMPELASRLGISDRYLRLLFQEHLGMSAKYYAQYQQCLLAKQLLHSTQLSVTEIALASGFNSIRRFNDCFRRLMNLSPSQLRRTPRDKELLPITLKMSYRPPFDWPTLQRFLAHRAIEQLEQVTDMSYSRSFAWHNTQGVFRLTHEPAQHRFHLELLLDDLRQLRPICANIRRLFDLDADSLSIDAHLAKQCSLAFPLILGLRLPGTWDLFEAGVRAILGQQISIVAAKNLVTQLVAQRGQPLHSGNLPDSPKLHLFPTAQSLVDSPLDFLKIPQARRNTLHAFAAAFIAQPHTMQDPDNWRSIKGIGPWTIHYAKMRGLSDPDIYLGSDLGVKKSVQQCATHLLPNNAAPWRSYLTLQLWQQQAHT